MPATLPLYRPPALLGRTADDPDAFAGTFHALSYFNFSSIFNTPLSSLATHVR